MPTDQFPSDFEAAPSHVRRWGPAGVAAALLVGVIAFGAAFIISLLLKYKTDSE